MEYGHVLKHERLIRDITEGRMRGEPARGRSLNQLLHDLANDDGCGYVTIKRAAKDREGCKHCRCQNLLCVYSRPIHCCVARLLK